MKKIIVSMFIVSMLLGACTPSLPDVEPGILANCSETVTYQIVDLAGNEIANFRETFDITFVVDSGSNMDLIFDDPVAVADYYKTINDGLRKANSVLSQIYPDDWFSERSESDIRLEIYGSRYPERGLCRPNHSVEQITLNDYPNNSSYYTVHNNLVEDKVFVKVTTPGDSYIEFWYPSEWLDEILRGAFTEAEPFVFQPVFTNTTSSVSSHDYVAGILESFAKSGEGSEMGTFELAENDFEGRTMLREVLAKWVNVSAVKAGEPSSFILIAEMTTQQNVAASISASQNDIQVSGWTFFGVGALNGSGGGSTFESSYESSFTRIVKGSIFLVP